VGLFIILSAYEVLTGILSIFKTSPFVQPTFFATAKKAGKEIRQRAMYFSQLSTKFSKPFALAPGNSP
jgi:hypothetical protein